MSRAGRDIPDVASGVAKGRVCVFCGSLGPLNRAHVVAKSFLKVLPESPGALRQTTLTRDANTGQLKSCSKESNRDPRERYAKITCHDCNGQWMATIEEEALDLVVNLANNIRVELSEPDRGKIAAWLGAAGVVAGKMGGGPDFVCGDGAYMRTHNNLPSGFKAWLIYGDVRRNDLLSQHRSGLTRYGASWLAWFWIGSTIFLVASEGAAHLLNARLEGISSVVQQLHPPVPGSKKWPPPAATFTGGITPAHMRAIGSL